MRASSITIVEVGPRDGLQSEPGLLPTKTKVSLLKRLIDAGLRKIEVASFVSPKRVPQMADAEQLMLARAVDRPCADGLPAARRAADAVANIGAYFARHGRAPIETDADNLAAVLGAAFGELETDTVRSLCGALVGGRGGAAER